MTKDTQIIFIGPMGGGKIPTNGASVKNFYIAEKLQKHSKQIILIDTEKWKKNPFILFKLVLVILFKPKAKYILSLNNMSAYRLISVLNIFPRKRDIYYWVIGGSIADWIKQGRVSKTPYLLVSYFLVEGNSMKHTLNECGFDNIIVVPNFKKITYIPLKPNAGKKVRFLFLSRINPHKGCDYILSVTKRLSQIYEDKFEVDFYGEVSKEYSDFYEKVESLPNVSYKGFIDLRENRNYDKIAGYDAMLFPTYWHGEGFPGIMVDALIAGLPIIASDWHLNKNIVNDGKTGILIAPCDEEALYRAMEECIKNPIYIRLMASECQKSATNFDVDKVVTPELFKTIGLIC